MNKEHYDHVAQTFNLPAGWCATEEGVVDIHNLSILPHYDGMFDIIEVNIIEGHGRFVNFLFLDVHSKIAAQQIIDYCLETEILFI